MKCTVKSLVLVGSWIVVKRFTIDVELRLVETVSDDSSIARTRGCVRLVNGCG